MTETIQTDWPEGVSARYLTVGGATVDVRQGSNYFGVSDLTETRATCAGCEASHAEEWGWDFWAHERGEEQPDSYDKTGRHATAQALEWAQAHAETCRAMPKPTA